MTCFSTFLKYPLTVLTETLATYTLMYRNAFSTAFTIVHCFKFKIKVFALYTTSLQSSDRTVEYLGLFLQNERQICEEFALHLGGTNGNDVHACS